MPKNLPTPKKLPLAVFLKTFKYAPRVAVNLIIENRRGEILLTQRGIEPGKGKWHMPGSFILKGEGIATCITRVARHELGLKIRAADAILLGAFDNLHGDPRGHVIDLIYKFVIGENARAKLKIIHGATKETKSSHFFNRPPREIGFNQGKTLRKLGYK